MCKIVLAAGDTLCQSLPVASERRNPNHHTKMQRTEDYQLRASKLNLAIWSICLHPEKNEESPVTPSDSAKESPFFADFFRDAEKLAGCLTSLTTSEASCNMAIALGRKFNDLEYAMPTEYIGTMLPRLAATASQAYGLAEGWKEGL